MNPDHTEVAKGQDWLLTKRRLEDLEFARKHYVLVSRAFTPDNRKRALEWVQHLSRVAGSLSHEEFLVGMLGIAACARNGHDAFDFGGSAWQPDRRLPLRFIAFPDAWVVARAASDQSDLVGARVRRIENLTPRQLIERLAVVSGGEPQYTMWNAMWVVEFAGLLHALRLASDPDRLQLTITTSTGRRFTRRVAFVPHHDVPRGASSPRLWSPEPFDTDAEHEWRNAAPQDSPLYLRDPDLPYRTVPLPTLDATYVQFRTNLDSKEHPIRKFLADTTRDLKKRGPKNLVVDLRFNTGGNIDLTRDWLRTLPGLSDRIYILTSRYTFSAGIVAAAALKHDAGERATIVGEPVGDRMRFWSEGHSVCMPNSAYCLHVTTGLWDLADGCAGQDGCYGDSYQVTVGSLSPDIRAPLTAEAWLAGRDPMMSAVERDIARRSPRND